MPLQPPCTGSRHSRSKEGAFPSQQLPWWAVGGQGLQGPPKCAHLEATPLHLCYGREDGSPPARAEQVHI